MDRNLERAEENGVLAHELVHDDRGGCDVDGAPATWPSVAIGEEQSTDRIAAGRLVPPDQLLRRVVARESVCGHVDAAAVAEERGGVEHVAAIVLQRLDRRAREAVDRVVAKPTTTPNCTTERRS